jgi:hypothetical protein
MRNHFPNSIPALALAVFLLIPAALASGHPGRALLADGAVKEKHDACVINWVSGKL